jgi:hypothetical protein
MLELCLYKKALGYVWRQGESIKSITWVGASKKWQPG